jgi:alpha-1,3-glucosyltransferase|tara:strand:+ start:274 stop:855 length:582 start_codon:yes stop_codon:yes gene_type:complete
MLGYHVHEKAILMAIVPVGMLAADSVDDAKVYLLMSWIGHFSLFPLLEERRELLSKILITSIHMLLSYVSLDRYHRSEQRAIHIDKSKRGIRFTTTEHLYLCGIGVLFVFVEFIHPVMFVKINKMGESTVVMPFLPLMLMSIYCAIGLMYTWHLSYKQYIAKIKRIMSYAESPYLAPDVPTVNEIPPHFDLNQ